MLQRRMFAWILLVALVLPLIVACGEAAEPDAPPTAASPAPGELPETSPLPEDEASPPAEEDASPEASPEDEASPEASPEAGAGDGETTEYTKENPPAVANAEAARQYEGTTITYYGGAVGLDAELDDILSQKFTEDTGVQVNVIRRPEDATETYATYQRFFQAQSQDVDVMMVDVIWPGAFAQHLVDLTDALGEAAQDIYPASVENNTIDGKLVAMPWFGDFGMLYYRTDLLEKYDFDGPPETWDELEQMAQTIMEGEREEGNANFTGFVFQGNAYEGLTCDALEWVASNGGGTFIENGEVTINNPAAIDVLNKARGWVGTIAPQGVTGYGEEEAREIFQGGNAAFMRNWPYAYGLAQSDDSPIQGNFDVAPLPHGEGGNSVGTVGGWQLGVSAYSQNQEAAIEFVRYMTSPEVVTYRAALPGSTYVPLYPSVAEDPAVVSAQPYLERLADVERVTRPSAETGDRYNQASTVIFQGVNQILNGQDAAQVVPQMEQQLQRLVR